MRRGFRRLDDADADGDGEATATAAAAPSWLSALAGASSVFAYRALICTLAIALLWSTSLSVARSVTQAYVSSPSFDGVVLECQQAYDEVKRQRGAHLQCTRRQLAQCDDSLGAALDAETRRTHTAAAANGALVNAALERQEGCAQRRLQALVSLQQLQAAGVALRWRRDWRSESCPSERLERARALVGDMSVATGEAMDVASGYAREMSMLHSLSLDRLDARVGYDDRYVREKGDALRSLPRALDDVSSEQARGLDLSPPLS